MTTERIDIVVREDGSRTVRRNLEDIGNSARGGAAGVDRLQGSMGQLKSLIVGMGIGYGVSEIVKYIDTWANLEGRLGLVTSSYRNLKQVQNELFEVAQRTRSAYEGTADLYSRIARSTKDLNATDRDRIKVTEAINKGIVISGSSAESANAAIIQLGQGFASGTLRGEELNSVLEQTPRVAEAIAAGMGKTVGQLRAMGAAGQLTSEAVFKALLSQSSALQAEFGKMPQTIGQSFTVLNNEILKFVGTGGQANNVAGVFASTLGFLAQNLSTLASLLTGFLLFKVAEFFTASTIAIYNKIAALRQYAVQMNADRVFEIAAAEATLAHAAAQRAVAVATLAAIESSRADVVAKLAQANANIASSRAAIQAATAAGAQSFALRVLAQSELALAAAQGVRSASTAQLAVLGQQQARVSAQIATATAAEAAATTALAGARGAATGAAGLAARALGFLGGPIGVVTTLLSLGVTAWMLWGNKAKAVETEVEQTLAEKTDEVINSLQKQIDKLKERNKLMGIAPDVAKAETPAAVAQQNLLTEMNRVGNDKSLSGGAKTEILRVLGARYNTLSVQVKEAAGEQEKLDKAINGDKLSQWMGKHTEYMDKAGQLAHAIGEAKKELGAAFTPEIEKKITAFYNKKDTQPKHDALLQYKAEIAALEQQQALQREIASGASNHAEAQYQAGETSLLKFIQFQETTQLSENARNKAFVQKQLDLTKGMGQEQVAAREKYTGELAILDQQALNIKQATADKTAAIYTSRERQALDASNAELASINATVANGQEKLKYFDMLPAAITRATIAELENQKATLEGSGFVDQAKIASINARIEALGRLAGVQAASAQQDFDYGMAQKLADEWRKAGDVIGDALSKGFGQGGAALGKMMKGYGDLKGKEADLKKTLADRVKVADGSAKRISEAEIEYSRDSLKARIGAYADMAGAAKEYFAENTAGYKVLRTVETAFRAWQIAEEMANAAIKMGLITWLTSFKVGAIATETAANVASVAPNIAADGAKSTASGVLAVVRAIASMPYPMNLIAGGMTLAAVVGLGVAMSGGMGGGGVSTPHSSSAEVVQAAQGRGTVTGDPTAQSKSLSNAMELLEDNSSMMLPLTQSMLQSLRGIESAVQGAAKGLLQTSGISTGSAFGTTAMNDQNTFSASKTRDITDSGIQLQGSFGALRSGAGTGNQYEKVLTTSDGGMFRSGWTNLATNTKGLGAPEMKQFQLIFDNMGNMLTEAGTALGYDAKQVTDYINSMNVNLGVSLRGLSGQDLIDQLNAGLSTVFDGVTTYLFPQIDQFNKVGEGLGETVVRVATGVESAAFELEKLGLSAVNYTKIANKQGDVDAEIVRESIMVAEGGSRVAQMMKNMGGSAQELASSYKDLLKVRQLFSSAGLKGYKVDANTVRGAGDLDALQDGVQTFFDEFLTKAQQNAANTHNLVEEFGKLGLALPKSRDAFAELVRGLNDGTPATNKLVGKLLTLSESVAELYGSAGDAEEIANSRREMQIKLTELMGDKERALAMSRQDELDALDASLRQTQDYIYHMEDASTALEDVTSRMGSFKDSLKSLRTSMQMGGLSVLSPEQQYQAARQLFEDTVAKAKQGDQAALDSYSQVAQDFLGASQKVYASSSKYVQDYQRVMADTEQLAKWADGQIDAATASLNALKQQVDLLGLLNGTTQQVVNAVESLGSDWRGSTTGVDYVTMESTLVAPLLAKVDALTVSLEALRTENKELMIQQTGVTSSATMAAAGNIVDATEQAAADRAWNIPTKMALA